MWFKKIKPEMYPLSLPLFTLSYTLHSFHNHLSRLKKKKRPVKDRFYNSLSKQPHAMAPHSSTLAWKIPWTEEPGRLQSTGSLRVGYDWATSHSLFHFHTLEKEMATHSSVLAWRIPGTAKPGGLLSMGSHRVGHDWSNLAAAADYYQSYQFWMPTVG